MEFLFSPSNFFFSPRKFRETFSEIFLRQKKSPPPKNKGKFGREREITLK
jgi:hypothetical protein